ncbi:hypothetical protein V8E52_004919 [Russula decolorans]
MPTTSLAGNVQESKAQRQERLQSRFRDRGGIFVPSEGNALVEILLARGVNGESPAKKRPPRKSAVTPKPRSSASRTKTSRTGASTRASRKSAFVASEGDENYPPSMKKRRGTSGTSKLQVSKRTNGMDASISAGLSLPHAATQRKPFADQLADAIKHTKTRTVPDSCSPSMKIEPAEPATSLGAPSQQGKRERALGKCKAKPAAVLAPRYSDEPKDSGEEHVSKSTKCPALLLVERQGREKQDGQTRGQGFAAPEIEQMNGAGVNARRPPLLHDQSESGSDSGIPLAKKHAAAKLKRARSLGGTRTKPKTSKEEAPPLLTKKRGRPKGKALPRPAEDSSAKAKNIMETVDTGPRRKKPSVADEGDAETETVPLAPRRRRKVAPNANPPPPPTTTTMLIEVDSGEVGREVQVLQGKIALVPAKVPRKRKERIKASFDKDDKNNDDEHEYENTHGLPQKKRQRADLTASRMAKENKEMSRSAREAATKVDKPLPSPVKKPARVTPKPSSKAKAKTARRGSRAGAGAKSGTRRRGLPLDVRRRIEVVAQNFLATDFDDDDPIDFLR